ncbi:MAG: hypothetical protein JXJ17_08715 [Anaerolineae bacterium]|nr:hypothetical protein [Anaerolineae bacterium]
MIYDCFMFFNELDLLTLRLNELSPVVDRVVLVEATKTFSLKPKPLYYLENKGRFEEFNDRIIHVIVDKYPVLFNRYKKVSFLGFLRRLFTSARFERVSYHSIDFYQKNHIMEGLKDCSPDDLIIFSDLDEIPNPKQVESYKDVPGIRIFKLGSFYYYLNCKQFYKDDYSDPDLRGKPVKLYAPAMAEYRYLSSPYELRTFARHCGGIDYSIPIPATTIIENGGWHFSFMGGKERIIQKLESYAHDEYNTDDIKDEKRLEQIMQSGGNLFGHDDGREFRFVEIDESFPRELQQNREVYSHLIRNL